MREMLEVLGIVRHDPSRREPVALPSWLRWAAPTAMAVLIAASFLAFWAIRALLI